MQSLCEACDFHVLAHSFFLKKGLWPSLLWGLFVFVWKICLSLIWLELRLRKVDPYGSGFDLFVGKTLPYGLARLFDRLSLHVTAVLRCWDSITRAGLYIKLASIWLRSTDRWPSLLGFPHALLHGYTHSLILCEQISLLANLCRDLSIIKLWLLSPVWPAGMGLGPGCKPSFT